jgi:O-antigen/teichoic acid export membrane protein
VSVFKLLGRNFVVAAGSHVVARLVYLVALAIVARRFGAEAVGGFAVASAVGTCFMFASDLGLGPRLVRESAARPRDADREYAQSLGAKIMLLPVLAIAVVVLYALWPFDPSIAALSAAFAVGGIVESFSVLNLSACRARERFEPEAISQVTQAIVFLQIVVWSLSAGYGMLAIACAAFAAAATEVLVSTAFVVRVVRPAVSFRGAGATLRAALPFAPTTIGAVAIAQLDVVVLSLVATPLEVGHYAAVSRLLLGGAYFCMLAADVVIPSATLRYVAGQEERFRRTSAVALRLMFASALPVVLALVASAPMLVRVIYGPSFGPVAALLQLGSAFAAL